MQVSSAATNRYALVTRVFFDCNFSHQGIGDGAHELIAAGLAEVLTFVMIFIALHCEPQARGFTTPLADASIRGNTNCDRSANNIV